MLITVFILSILMFFAIFIILLFVSDLDDHHKEIMEKLTITEQMLHAVQGHIELKNEQLMMMLNENDPNLSPNNSHWILENESVSKYFKPGHITKVINSKDKTVMEYTYSNEEISCSKLLEGKLIMRTDFSIFGAPLRGIRYDSDGNIAEEFSYDRLGQAVRVPQKTTS